MIYPYRMANGNRSILQAVSLPDARHHFSAYPGTVFCEIPKPPGLDLLYTSVDFPETVDRMLKQNPTFCA